MRNECFHNVQEALVELMETHKEKSDEYKDTIDTFGDVMMALFRDELWLHETDYARFGLLVQIISKVVRYTKNIDTGHQDSLHDLAMYAILLKEYDKQHFQRDDEENQDAS